MNAIVAAIITASATLIGIFIIETLYGKKIFNRLEKHDEVDGLSHKTLSFEHMDLKNNTNNILQLNQKLESKIDSVDIFLKTEKENKLVQFENLTDKHKEMKLSIDRLTAFSDEFQRVSLHNTKLIREIEDLQQENKELRIYGRKLRDRINDLERDDGYER